MPNGQEPAVYTVIQGQSQELWSSMLYWHQPFPIKHTDTEKLLPYIVHIIQPIAPRPGNDRDTEQNNHKECHSKVQSPKYRQETLRTVRESCSREGHILSTGQRHLLPTQTQTIDPTQDKHGSGRQQGAGKASKATLGRASPG